MGNGALAVGNVRRTKPSFEEGAKSRRGKFCGPNTSKPRPGEIGKRRCAMQPGNGEGGKNLRKKRSVGPEPLEERDEKKLHRKGFVAQRNRITHFK